MFGGKGMPKLEQLVDMNTFQTLQDGYAVSSGFSVIVTDPVGNSITRGSNFSDYYNKFKKGPVLDSSAAQRTLTGGKAVIFTNSIGLTEFVAPIILEGTPVGYFVGGEVLGAPADHALVKRMADEMRVSEDEISSMLAHVPVITRDRLVTAASFLQSLVASFLRRKRVTAPDMDQLGIAPSMEASARIAELSRQNYGFAKETMTAVDRLGELAQRSVSEVKATNETVKVIQDIAMNTRILGFNASIEASRAKESGKGFGVIAQEVRTLADTSKASADKIETSIKLISSFAADISNTAQEIHKLLGGSIERIETIHTLMGHPPKKNESK